MALACTLPFLGAMMVVGLGVEVRAPPRTDASAATQMPKSLRP